MAGYEILADVSGRLLEIIRDAVCPGILPAREMAALGAPDGRESEALLSLCLYDLRESEGFVPARSYPLLSEAREAPLAVTPSYMVYFTRSVQSPSDALTEHRVLGRVLQALRASGPLDPESFCGTAGGDDEPVPLAFSRLDIREKQALWSAFSEPLRPAVYFEAGPLLIDSGGLAAVRVREEGIEVRR